MSQVNRFEQNFEMQNKHVTFQTESLILIIIVASNLDAFVLRSLFLCNTGWLGMLLHSEGS